MARGRAAGYDDQRDLILQHAAALFARQGYAATSMNEVAQACGLSKPAIYHYFTEKYALLFEICDTHLTRLQALEQEVKDLPGLDAQQRLRSLIARFVEEYALSAHAHRVLTESVRYLKGEDHQQVLDKERALVAGFSKTLAQIRPDLDEAGLSRPSACCFWHDELDVYLAALRWRAGSGSDGAIGGGFVHGRNRGGTNPDSQGRKTLAQI